MRTGLIETEGPAQVCNDADVRPCSGRSAQIDGNAIHLLIAQRPEHALPRRHVELLSELLLMTTLHVEFRVWNVEFFSSTFTIVAILSSLRRHSKVVFGERTEEDARQAIKSPGHIDDENRLNLTILPLFEIIYGSNLTRGAGSSI